MQDTNLKYPGGTKNLCFQTITPWHWKVRKTPSWSYWRTQKGTGLPSMITAYLQKGYIRKLQKMKWNKFLDGFYPISQSSAHGADNQNANCVWRICETCRSFSRQWNFSTIKASEWSGGHSSLVQMKPDSPCSQHLPDILKNSKCSLWLLILPFVVEVLGYEKF